MPYAVRCAACVAVAVSECSLLEQCVGTVSPVLGHGGIRLDSPAVASLGGVVIFSFECLAAFGVVLLSRAAAGATATGHGLQQVAPIDRPAKAT